MLLRGNAYRTKIMGRSRYKFTNANLPHFITCTVLHWIPIFTRPETVTILLESLRLYVPTQESGNEEAHKTDRSYQFWQEGRAYQSLFFHKPCGEYLSA